ncbi:MAG: PD-(D/E)XK nuclease domain-containing protein, partial [bacterium]|nr:PD-(D/E)XK nuclease domain-containing protein [bacterium]
ILEYFNEVIHQSDDNKLYEALLSKNTVVFEKHINDVMKKTISYYDTKEAFYHGLLVGLLSRNTDYRVESNREMGDGRSDIVLYQEGYEDNAIILELKVCRKAENIRTIAAKALEQINERNYESEARSLGYVNIFKYGIAFKGKFCCVTTD